MKTEEKKKAYVMKNHYDGSVDIYVPELMAAIDMESEIYTKNNNLNSNIVKNDNFDIRFDDNIETCNYYTVNLKRVSNMDAPCLAAGESGFVTLLDDDIKSGSFEYYSVDESVRTYDKVRIFCKDSKQPKDGNDDYEIKMDSEEKIIKIFMNNGRDEISKYTIQIDGSQGNIIIKDEEGNEIELRSEGRISLKEKSGGSIVLQNNTIDLNSSTVNVNASSFNLNVGSFHTAVLPDICPAK